jgi:sortase A
MRDRRSVDELTIEELEAVLRLRRRQARVERLRQLGKGAEDSAFDPLIPKTTAPEPPDLPSDHRRFAGEGATAQYRVRPLDEGEQPARPERSRRRIRWDWVRDKSLLIIELAVLIALVAVLAGLLATVKEINEESSQAQALPTPSPTPLIRLVLPSGHTPPDSPGGPAPIDVPVHLQDRVRPITPVPIPTAGPEHAVRIQIPAIGVDARVVEGDDWDSLKQGAGHHLGSANPGERGNCVISAHNDIFGEIFRDLPKLDLGDEVSVHTVNRVFRYVVTQKRVIDPEEVSVMEPTSSPVLTLISCYPYGIDTHRIVVIAQLEP